MLVNAPCWVMLVTHSLVLQLTITEDRAHELQSEVTRLEVSIPLCLLQEIILHILCLLLVKLYLKNTYYFKKGEQMSGYLFLTSDFNLYFFFIL